MNSYEIGYNIGYYLAQIFILGFLALIVYLIIRLNKKNEKVIFTKNI